MRNEINCGFILQSTGTGEITELSARIHQQEHEKSGAQLVRLERAAENKAPQARKQQHRKRAILVRHRTRAVKSGRRASLARLQQVGGRWCFSLW